MKADVIVVGGGLAGLEVAKELDRRGAGDVLVLEAGPGDDLAHVNAVNDAETALRMWTEPASDKHFWRPWSSRSTPHYDGVAGLRRRVGGRSLYWHGVVLPLEPWALCEPWWPASVVSDLTESWQDGPSLYERVRADLDAWCGNSPETPQVLDIGDYRLATTPQAIRGSAASWQAYSPVDYWRSGNRSARVVAETEVLNVSVAAGRVRGVVVRHGSSEQTHEIPCGTVVLAAGTIESTRLALQAWNAADPASRPAVDGLTDHLVHGFVAPLHPREVPGHIAELADQESFLFAPLPAARSNLFVRLYRNQNGAVVLDAWAMGEQLPSAEGLVECVPGADQPWKVLVSAGLCEADREVIDAQHHALRDFWVEFCAATGRPASKLEFGEFLNPPKTLHDVVTVIDALPADGRPVTWSNPLGTEYHEASTLGLGRVLGDSHEFPTVQGLFAAGPATFSRPGAANPSLTSFALARRLAALLDR